MARTFVNSTSDKAENISAAPVTAAPLTIAAWAMLTTTPDNDYCIAQIQDRSVGDNYYRLGLSPAGDHVQFLNNGSGGALSAVGTSVISQDQWYHVAGVEAAVNARSVWLDGVQEDTDSASGAPSGLDSITVGQEGDSSPSDSWEGALAEVAVWNVALTQSEIESLAAGYSPLFIRPESRVAYWLLEGRESPEPDVLGWGDLTLTNTSYADHPPMMYPAPSILGAPAVTDNAIVKEINEVIDIVHTVIRTLGLARIISEAIDLGRRLLIDHETGDLSQYDSTTLTPTISAPGLGGTNYKLDMDAGDTATKAISLVSGNTISISFLAEIIDDTLYVGPGVIGPVLYAGSVVSFRLQASQLSAGIIQIRAQVKDDGAPAFSFNSSIWVSGATPVVFSVKTIFVRSTSASSNDGIAMFYVDGVLEDTLTGLDFYDNFNNLSSLVVEQSVGSSSIDEINLRYTQEALAIRDLVRVVSVSEVINMVEARQYLLGLIRIIAETVNLLLIGGSDIVLDHETGGYDQYTSAPDCGEIVTPGIVSLYLSRVYATSVTPGVKTFSAPSGSYFSIRFYLDLSCYTLPDTTWHTVGIRIGDGGSNNVLWTEILNEVPDSVRISVIDDNAATTNGATIGITRTNVYLYEIFVYKAASTSSLDGRIEFHLNGSLVDTIVGLDLFDQFANMTQAEIGVIDQPGMDGYIDIDEINITTETTNAIYILRTGLIKVIGEIVTLIETTVRLPSTILKIVGEVVNLVSGYLTNRSMTISEVVNVPETDLGILGLIKILAETTNRAEVRQHVLGLFKIIAETVNIDSGLVRLTALLRVATETVNIGSGLVRTIGLVRVRDELIRVFETKVRPIGFVRLAAETINVSEGTLLRRAIAKVVSETINLISASLRWSGLVRVDSNAISVPETTVKLSGLLRLLAEQVRLNEGTIAARGLVKVRSELIRVWSGELSVRGLVRIVVTETINLASAVASRVGRLVKIVGEIVNVNSASLRKQGLSRVVGEVVSIVPGLVGLRGMIRSISEQVNLVSSALSPRGLVKRTTELIRLQEANYPVLGLVRIISSTVRVASDLLKFKGIVAIIADVINIAETVTGSPVLYTLIRLARTGVSVSDTIRGVALKAASHAKGVAIDSRQTGVKSE